MKIKEIFYSIQGEGAHAGTPAVFVRFAGCNLRCPFCDTDFANGTEMSEQEIVSEVKKLSPHKATYVVLTGGEPTLQVTTSFVDLLHKNNCIVAIETNGTRDVLENIDWITVSPKQLFLHTAAAQPVVKHCSELKVVYDGVHSIESYNIKAEHYYVQPCDTGNEEKNEKIIKNCINFVKNNPTWKISVQLHKILNVQ